MIPWRYSFLASLLILGISLSAQNIPLKSVVEQSGCELRWNPYRERGLLYSPTTTISFKLGTPLLILDNYKIINGVEFKRVGGDIFLNQSSATTLYRLLGNSNYMATNKNESSIFNIPVIIIDPGHGGKDSGALGNLSFGQIMEKDIVLDISKYVVNNLRDRYPEKKILLTRDEDIFLTLEERVDIANSVSLNPNEAIIYISIHANASLNKKAQGFEVWYLPEGYRRDVLNSKIGDSQKLTTIVNAIKEDEISLEGKRLAGSILDSIAIEIGDKSSNRGLKEEIWFVVRKARMASVLIEVGFITNEKEGSRLNTPMYLKNIGDGIYNGISNFVTSYESVGR
ncbi:MAG: hypothetical protein B6229_05390 [Spirochaetaceae bacterium 4572_7]|nr:MAG: hypothetical protein B6229_05390 [Spirochaetaceae bacterium 4572_7]